MLNDREKCRKQKKIRDTWNRCSNIKIFGCVVAILKYIHQSPIKFYLMCQL